MKIETSEHLKTCQLFVTRPLFLLLLFTLFAFATNTVSASAQTKRQTRAAEVATIMKAVETTFGSGVEVVRGFKPFFLIGDFNGDGARDLLVVVLLRGQQDRLPPDVRVLSPFGYGPAAYPSDPLAKPSASLAIIHGTKAGWQNAPAAESFLLVGASPILILQYDRGVSTHPADHENLMEIVRKVGKRRRGALRPPGAAKGDSVLLGTEMADSFLYWNGKTYRWEEEAGGE
jgi:hypothetical protein